MHRSSFVCGLGEVYEPSFAVGKPELTYPALVEEVVSLSSALQRWRGEAAATAAGVAHATHAALRRFRGEGTAVALYGFEQSLLHAVAQLVGVSLVEAIGAFIGGARTARHSHVRINAFASLRGVGAAFDRMDTNGGRRRVAKMKVKVGDPVGANAQRDAEEINALVESFPGERSAWLRLDANQSWTVDQALLFARSLSPAAVRAIDYVEEPLRFGSGDALLKMISPSSPSRSSRSSPSPSRSSPSSPSSSSQQCESVSPSRGKAVRGEGVWASLAIGFDESLCLASNFTNRNGAQALASAHVDKLLSSHSDVRFIVKPSLLSLSTEYLQKAPGTVTISCTFESGAGLAFLVCLAAWFGEVHHGIHAREDMASTDEWTAAFAAMVRPSPDGGRHIAVWQAERLLNDIAMRFASIP